MKEVMADLVAAAPFILIGGAWLTSVITCIKNDWWTLLLMDFLLFPVGVIHGIDVWFE